MIQYVQYKVYNRQTLEFVDGGIVKDFNVDMDYMANNTSTIDITAESTAFKGDVIALMHGAGNAGVILGEVMAIDNTAQRISFRHLKSIFNDNMINVFKYSRIAGVAARFEAVATMRSILDYAFVSTTDPRKRLPLDIRTHGVEHGAVFKDDSEVLNILDFIDHLFDRFNIYLHFEIDFTNNRIICTVTKNSTSGLVIKDNIKLSVPEFDNNELPASNKVVLYDRNNGNVVARFFLLQNNTVTTNANAPNRIVPPRTRYVVWDAVEANRQGFTMQELAESELQGNIYNHCILLKLAKRQTMIRSFDFMPGDGVAIIYKGREYLSVFTGLKFKMQDSFVTCIFGKARIDFSDRMKIYNDRRYQKKGGFY